MQPLCLGCRWFQASQGRVCGDNGTFSRLPTRKPIAKAHPEQVLAVAFNYRAYPLVQLARTMIRSGELGRPHLIHGSYLQDWLLYQSDYNWCLNSAVGGKSRAMADIGSHWCDLIGYLTGDRIQQLCAQYQRIYDVRTGGRDNGETFAATGGAQSIPVWTERREM